MRRPRRTGERRGRGRRVVEDSPRASEGFAATVPGEDAAGGEGRFRRQGGVRVPTGGGTTNTPWFGARPPRGEGPGARDAFSGVIPTGGGTRLTRHSGRGPIARGDDEASKRIIHGPSALGDPFDKTSRSGSRPSLSVPAIWVLCPFCRLSTLAESRVRIDVSSATYRLRVGGECSASSGNSSASRGNGAEPGVAAGGCGSTLRY
jgi:hypothetical protein